jgi:catechol 2,3-dioxygenase-like lactoylglutathione lyase family enzyme
MPTANRIAVPVLPSSDLARSQAFYSYLGFRVLGRTGDYLRVADGTIELHLYLDGRNDPLANSAGCYLRVEDPGALCVAWTADGVNCLQVPNSSDYGDTLFAVVDPDGNTLRYGPLDRAAVA